MNKAAMLSIFLRSLTIQASFNFRTRQGVGFAFALLPLLDRDEKGKESGSQGFLARHMRMFSTNPYLVPAVVGSVARLEIEGKGPADADAMKKALMGPYAAIGDAFFYGALRLFSAALAVLLAVWGSSYAPLAFLVLFIPPQAAVSVGGFVSSIRRGREGFHYIRALDLPRDASILRYGALAVLTLLSVFLADGLGGKSGFCRDAVGMTAGSAMFLLTFAGKLKEISSEKLLYGIAIGCMAFSIFYGNI
jgi:mannose/fructose/N-acetylgalactosamine-specific phosphotransferase system component IID